ncbi:MAG: hypothetical protein ACXIUD_17365 [Mongoliitalea sp.]
MDFEKELGIKIIDIYKRTIFGKVSKVELDLVVFGFLVKETFKNNPDINSEGYFNWFRIGNTHLRQLSFQLQITESRVANLLEQAALLELKEDETDHRIVEEILYLLQTTRQSIRDINEGKIKLYIPNKITKAAVTSYLAKNKSIPDLSFSQNVMTIRLIDLLPDGNSNKLLETLNKLASEVNFSEKSKEIELIIKKANDKSGLEKIQHVTSATLKLFLGTGGEYLSTEFFDLVKSIIKQ